MRAAALAMAAPEPHLAQPQVAMARIGEPLMLHDARDAAMAALDDDDVPLMEIAPANLIRRYDARFVSHQNLSQGATTSGGSGGWVRFLTSTPKP